MSEPKCPRWGEPCIKHECEFYDQVPASGKYECRDKLTNLFLNDIANYLHLTLKSSEQHRETDVQLIRSQMSRDATPELLRLVGMEDKKKPTDAG